MSCARLASMSFRGAKVREGGKTDGEGRCEMGKGEGVVQGGMGDSDSEICVSSFKILRS